MYFALLIFPSGQRTSGPFLVPCMAPHIITDVWPLLKVGTTQSSCSRSPGRLKTQTGVVPPEVDTLVSSVQITRRQSSTVQCRRSRQNFSLAARLEGLRPGFIAALCFHMPIRKRARRTVLPVVEPILRANVSLEMRRFFNAVRPRSLAPRTVKRGGRPDLCCVVSLRPLLCLRIVDCTAPREIPIFSAIFCCPIFSFQRAITAALTVGFSSFPRMLYCVFEVDGWDVCSLPHV